MSISNRKKSSRLWYNAQITCALPQLTTSDRHQKYCGIRTWYSAVLVNDKKIRRPAILGLKADVETIVYLYKIIETAIDRETFYYQQSRDYQRLRGSRNARSDTKAATSSFQIGMASRINRRLVDMARELNPSPRQQPARLWLLSRIRSLPRHLTISG